MLSCPRRASRHGPSFVAVLGQCRVWLNGEPAELDTAVGDGDEIAVLPPVSGGAGVGVAVGAAGGAGVGVGVGVAGGAPGGAPGPDVHRLR